MLLVLLMTVSHLKVGGEVLDSNAHFYVHPGLVLADDSARALHVSVAIMRVGVVGIGGGVGVGIGVGVGRREGGGGGEEGVGEGAGVGGARERVGR